MKELIENLKHISFSSARSFVLLDTCFLANVFEHAERTKELLKLKNLAMISFNAEEFIHIEKNLPHETRKMARKVFSDKNITIIDIDVHPGEWQTEKKFVNSIEPMLLKKIADASDAVLIAAAISTRSDVLTKDRHHIYTAALENLANEYKIKVCKELKDLI